MITENYKVVIAVNAQEALSIINRELTKSGVFAKEIIDQCASITTRVAIDQLFIAQIDVAIPSWLTPVQLKVIEQTAMAAGIYLWRLLTNVLVQWAYIKSIRLVGDKELWLCL